MITESTAQLHEQQPAGTVECPVCGGEARVAITAEDNHYGNSGKFSIHRCHDCGHMFQSPLPSAEQLASYYPQDYYSFQPPETDLSPRGLRHRGIWMAAHYARLRRRYRHLPLMPNPLAACLGWWLVRKRLELSIPKYVSGGTLCDFGCGSGSQVAVMQYFGWKASGIDISASAVAAGRRAGLDIMQGSIELLESHREAFDVVIASHSVEHVPDPAQLFRAFFHALKPGGTLVIEIPNAAAAALDGYGKHYYFLTLPVHLNIFSPRSLELTARRHGFTDIALRTSSYWWTHAESWLVRQDAQRAGELPRFNSHKGWPRILARLLSVPGFVRSLGRLRGDCLQLLCKRPAGGKT